MIGFSPKDEDTNPQPNHEITQPKPSEVTSPQPDRYQDGFPNEMNPIPLQIPSTSPIEIAPRNPEM